MTASRGRPAPTRRRQPPTPPPVPEEAQRPKRRRPTKAAPAQVEAAAEVEAEAAEVEEAENVVTARVEAPPEIVVAVETASGVEAEADADDLPEDRFLNRELSWLDFNARVLTLAEDPDTPLLERAKFIAIFASNLDEFYMVRVAGLKRRLQTGLPIRSPDGLSTREQLELIAEHGADLVGRHALSFIHDIEPALAAADIYIVRWAELDPGERDRMRDYFRDQVFPVLTPLAVDPAHPFPYISGLSLNLAVVV